MLSEKDRSVVYEMCRAGMSLETLKASFPKFEKADLEEIYNAFLADNAGESDDEITISCNCS